VAQEGISEINDIYGSGRTLLAEHYPYSELTIGTLLEDVCTTNMYGNLGSRNKLGNHKYIKFTIDTAGSYRISVERSNGTGSDPDFIIFQQSPFLQVGYAESPIDDREEVLGTLSSGDYLLDLSDWNTQENACFDIIIESI